MLSSETDNKPKRTFVQMEGKTVEYDAISTSELDIAKGVYYNFDYIGTVDGTHYFKYKTNA